NIINNTLGHPYSAIYSVNNKDNQKYLLSNISYDDKTNIPSNPVVQTYIDRWMLWINKQPCSNLQSLKWTDNITEKFDKANFCKKFQENIQYVWNHFLNDPVDGFNGNQGVYENPKLNGKNSLAFYSDCGLYDINNAPDKLPPNDGNVKNS